MAPTSLYDGAQDLYLRELQPDTNLNNEAQLLMDGTLCLTGPGDLPPPSGVGASACGSTRDIPRAHAPLSTGPSRRDPATSRASSFAAARSARWATAWPRRPIATWPSPAWLHSLP